MKNLIQRNYTTAEHWAEVYEVVRWLQLLVALISVLGSASIMIRVMSQGPRRSPELQPLLLLSVSDLLLALCWIIGVLLFAERRLRDNAHCYNLHTVEQVLFMSSFFFTLNYIWNLHREARALLCCRLHTCSVQFSNQVKTADKSTALLSGFLPLILMTPVFIGGNISQCQSNFTEPYRCLLMDTGALYLTSDPYRPIRACRLLHCYAMSVFVVTFLLTLINIMVLMARTRSVYRRLVTSGGYLGNKQRGSFRAADRRMLLYPLVFILCWGPAATVTFLRLLIPSACQGRVAVVLYVSQTFTSASQGFLNSLVYGWTHARLRRTAARTLRRDMDTQTPLLSSQKKKKKNYQVLPHTC